MFSLMNSTFALTVKSKIQQLANDESGQDLIEYALVAALIATAAVACMGSLTTALNTAFTNIANKLAI